jgi:hypothetical protein
MSPDPDGGTGRTRPTREPFADSGHDRFTGWLRARSEPDWTAATEHRFTEELAADTLEDDVFRRYLVADFRFVETLTATIGYAAARAPTTDAKRVSRGSSKPSPPTRPTTSSGPSTRSTFRRATAPVRPSARSPASSTTCSGGRAWRAATPRRWPCSSPPSGST